LTYCMMSHKLQGATTAKLFWWISNIELHK
jgi:hypothetical protein